MGTHKLSNDEPATFPLALVDRQSPSCPAGLEAEMEEERLNRLEGKMDKIEGAVAELLTANARTETMLQEFARVERRLNDHAGRVQTLERISASRGGVERILWLIFSAALAGVAAYIAKA